MGSERVPVRVGQRRRSPATGRVVEVMSRWQGETRVWCRQDGASEGFWAEERAVKTWPLVKKEVRDGD